MTPFDGCFVLTAAEMRAAEQRAMEAREITVEALIHRAGRAVAEAIHCLAGGSEVLIACGPGNNGGDGFVAAAALRATGVPVRVAALADPKTGASRAARGEWGDAVEPLADARAAPILVDAVFGTGQSRLLSNDLAETLARLADAARLTIAVDLPSGIDSDSGALLGALHCADVTLALANPKPAHLLSPGAGRCGKVRVLDIGLDPYVEGGVRVARRPDLPAPTAESHKYSRGMVAVVAGAMPGAAELSAQAALRAGAGYVLLLGDTGTTIPHAVVRRAFTAGALDDRRIGAVVVGPGLGRDDAADERLDAALAAAAPLIVDGDALHLLDDRRLARIHARTSVTILTPHAGEFDAVFGKSDMSRIERTRAAAASSSAVVVAKGASTVIAASDGQVLLTPPASPWLSTAGTGDVLTGAIAASVAGSPHASAIDLAAAGVWLHSEAARLLGGAFIADDLAFALSAVRASL